MKFAPFGFVFLVVHFILLFRPLCSHPCWLDSVEYPFDASGESLIWNCWIVLSVSRGPVFLHIYNVTYICIAFIGGEPSTPGVAKCVEPCDIQCCWVPCGFQRCWEPFLDEQIVLQSHVFNSPRPHVPECQGQILHQFFVEVRPLFESSFKGFDSSHCVTVLNTY